MDNADFDRCDHLEHLELLDGIMDRQRVRIAELENALRPFAIRHYECGDCWYSCPKSESYCGTYEGPLDERPCECGFERATAALASGEPTYNK